MQRTIRLLFVVTLAGSVLAASVGGSRRAIASGATGEPVIKTPGAVGDYLRRFHDRLHARWTQDFVKGVPATNKGAPANKPPAPIAGDASRQTTVSLTIRWDGTVAEAGIKTSSGSPDLDHAALDVARKSAPFPLPVPEVLSDDGYAHIDWTFAADQRGDAAGAELVRVEDPLEISLPRLISTNRIAEALRRVAGANAQPGQDLGPPAMDRFARLYLGRTFPDPVTDVAASVALAETGDRAQVPRLRAALTSRATSALAAKGLQKLGVDVCEAVREPLVGGATFAREIAVEAVRSAAVTGTSIAGCRSSLAATVADGKQPIALRLAALDLLVTYLPVPSRPVVVATMADKDLTLRGAAILASVRKGAGRPEMYRLAPMLHDKAVEVRAAASAGMVRAAGDLALDQLYLLSRETDPRPARAVAAELAQLSTPASAEFLGRMMKRNNRDVQVAAARALTARKDPAAKTELDTIKASPDASPEFWASVSGTDASATKATLTSAGNVSAAIEPCRQLLASRHNREAIAWIAAQLPALDARGAIDVLGVWLDRPSPAAAEAAPASPRASTQAPIPTAALAM